MIQQWSPKIEFLYPAEVAGEWWKKGWKKPVKSSDRSALSDFNCQVWWGALSLEGNQSQTSRFSGYLRCRERFLFAWPSNLDDSQRLQGMLNRTNLYNSFKADSLLGGGIHLCRWFLYPFEGPLQWEKWLSRRNWWNWMQSFRSITWLQSIPCSTCCKGEGDTWC